MAWHIGDTKFNLSMYLLLILLLFFPNLHLILTIYQIFSIAVNQLYIVPFTSINVQKKFLKNPVLKPAMFFL